MIDRPKGSASRPKVKRVINLSRKLIPAMVVLGIGLVGAVTTAAVAQATSGNPHKVTICHRTDSSSHPYVQITVDAASVDGVASKGRGDHRLEHQGDVWYPGHAKEPKWGDIIPPFYSDGTTPTGFSPLNWNEAGMAIFNNGCKPPTTPPPTTTTTTTPPPTTTTTTTPPPTTTTTTTPPPVGKSYTNPKIDFVVVCGKVTIHATNYPDVRGLQLLKPVTFTVTVDNVAIKVTRPTGQDDAFDFLKTYVFKEDSGNHVVSVSAPGMKTKTATVPSDCKVNSTAPTPTSSPTPGLVDSDGGPLNQGPNVLIWGLIGGLGASLLAWGGLKLVPTRRRNRH